MPFPPGNLPPNPAPQDFVPTHVRSGSCPTCRKPHIQDRVVCDLCGTELNAVRLRRFGRRSWLNRQVWRTKDRSFIHVFDMDTRHLQNTVFLLARKCVSKKAMEIGICLKTRASW